VTVSYIRPKKTVFKISQKFKKFLNSRKTKKLESGLNYCYHFVAQIKENTIRKESEADHEKKKSF
jgi:hypothetical protein